MRDIFAIADTLTERGKVAAAAIILAAVLLLTAWVENPADYEPPLPGPDAPCYVNGRTGDLICP